MEKLKSYLVKFLSYPLYNFIASKTMKSVMIHYSFQLSSSVSPNQSIQIETISMDKTLILAIAHIYRIKDMFEIRLVEIT